MNMEECWIHLPRPKEVHKMLYLRIFVVMAIIIAPIGVREIADHLKENGVKITLSMKVAYIAFVMFCWIAWLPATVYIGKHWSGDLSVVYFFFGMIFLCFSLVDNGKRGHDGRRVHDDDYDPTETLQHQ